MKTTDFINTYAESAEKYEYDDEVGMVKNNLHTMVRVSVQLAKSLNDNENVPEWCQEKIAVAKSMIVSVMDYMISQHEMGHQPDASAFDADRAFAEAMEEPDVDEALNFMTQPVATVSPEEKWKREIRAIAAQYQRNPSMLASLAKENGRDSREQVAWEYLQTGKVRIPGQAQQNTDVNWDEVIRRLPAGLSGQSLLNAASEYMVNTQRLPRATVNTLLNNQANQASLSAAYTKKSRPAEGMVSEFQVGETLTKPQHKLGKDIDAGRKADEASRIRAEKARAEFNKQWDEKQKTKVAEDATGGGMGSSSVALVNSALGAGPKGSFSKNEVNKKLSGYSNMQTRGGPVKIKAQK